MKVRERIFWFTAVIVINFIIGITFAKHLWFANRLYPLTPLIGFFSIIPAWVDYIVTPLFIFCLVISVIAPKPRRYIAAALLLVTFLFLQDQGRLFPSFYEYTLLLAALACCTRSSEDDGNSEYVLNACRLAIALIYIWSGIQKMNPLFATDFSWFFAPVVHAFPLVAPAVPILLIGAPFIEVLIGFGLIIKSTRKYSLFAALFMHASIFLLIGPGRGNWNDSAWAWSMGSALIVFVLFFRAYDVPTRDIILNQKHRIQQAVMVVFGLLPALSLFNLWDSALSFDVYSGNYFQPQIYVNEMTAENLPKAIKPYVIGLGGAAPETLEPLDLYRWSEDEFNANPYPTPRVFKNIARSLCKYADSPAGVQLAVRDKLALSGGFHWVSGFESYSCADL